jgi:hypothetical protein
MHILECISAYSSLAWVDDFGGSPSVAPATTHANFILTIVNSTPTTVHSLN